MKYITSCPECDTQFLINDELIEAYQGDVRCGNCDHVFNTQDRLTGVSDDIHSAEEYQASLNEGHLDEGTIEDGHDEIVYKADNMEGLDDIDLDPEPQINQPNFLEDLSKEKIEPVQTKRSRPLLFSMLVMLLLLAAGLQTAYYKRVEIAAQYPQFKPLLMQACAHLQCKVELPKELDSITIGSSDMQEDDTYESVINFTSSFRNTANYAQAYPNIELTLTNEKDKVVIRKLIQPEEYLAKGVKIENGIAGREVVDLKLPIYVHEAIVAGYRMLLVY